LATSYQSKIIIHLQQISAENIFALIKFDKNGLFHFNNVDYFELYYFSLKINVDY